MNTRKVASSVAPFALLLCLLAAFQPAAAQEAARPAVTAGTGAPKPAETRPEPLFVIRPSDVLDIFVWKEPELTREVFVRPDGRISLPLVQDLEAAGLTPGELKVKIQERLAKFVAIPEVTVIVKAIMSYRIFVVGKVMRPGAVNVEKPVTVLQSIALAGGFQEYAKESEITVIRTLSNESLTFQFNYREVIKGRQSEQNIFLRSGDVVVVP